jgi:catechol 2,3-dioxygenase-like lactoylglutathione lyase family enzyme
MTAVQRAKGGVKTEGTDAAADRGIPPAPPRVLETALYAVDLDAADGFYGELLGLERIVRVDNRHVFYRCLNSVLLLFNPDTTEIQSRRGPPVPPHGARGPGHVCFASEPAGLEAWRERFEAAGLPIEADFRWPNGARSIYLRDPAGNSVEFAEPHLWEAGS